MATTAAGTATGTPATDPHPGDKGADGVPEASEVHTGRGGTLGLSGTVTPVGASSVAIMTATATPTYAVASPVTSSRTANPRCQSLAGGDAVTFRVDPADALQIDELHAWLRASRHLPTAPWVVTQFYVLAVIEHANR